MCHFTISRIMYSSQVSLQFHGLFLPGYHVTISRIIRTILISSHIRRFTEETLTGKVRYLCPITISRVTSQVISRVIPYDITNYSYNCNQQSCKAFHGGNTEVTGKLERYFTLRFHELFLPGFHITI